MIANRVRMRKVKKGETPIESWDGIFADPEVGRVLKAKGLIADANKSSIKELATITSLNPSNEYNESYFYENEVITQFPELKYFTGMTSLSYTFWKCSSLTTVVIPEGVTSLIETFYNCSNLTTVVISSSVTSLPYTFQNCSSIGGIYVIKAVTPPTYNRTFYNAKVQAIYAPDASVSAYKSASGWNEFASKIYPMSDKPK